MHPNPAGEHPDDTTAHTFGTQAGEPQAGEPRAGESRVGESQDGEPRAGGPAPVPEAWQPPEPHPDIAPLRFLLGRWQGAGVGGYPTIESFRYGEEVSFSHNGKPFLIYTSRSWRLDEEGRPVQPSHMETGFWRPQPGNQVEVLLVQPTGIAEIFLGEITGTRIEMATDVVTRTASAKEVTAEHRLYGLVGEDLAYAIDLAAVGQPLQPHLSAQLKRVTAAPAGRFR